MSKRRKKTRRPTGGSGAKNPRSLANLQPGRGKAGPGNQRRTEHGGYAVVALERLKAKEVEVFEALSADLPLHEADGSTPRSDSLAVSLLSECLCRIDSVRSYLERRGIEDREGELRPAVEVEARLRAKPGLRPPAGDDPGLPGEARDRPGPRRGCRRGCRGAAGGP